MGDFSDIFNSIPFFTRWWLALTFGFSLLGRFSVLDYEKLILEPEGLIRGFQIWRPISSLFYYPITPNTGFHFLFNCYFLYNYSIKLETGMYSGRPADYCFLLLFNWLSCVVIGLATGIKLLMDPMVLSVLYIWCQLNQDQIVSFWFGTRFKAMYLPWVLLAFNLIINGGGILELVGILVGHAYFFLMYKYPQEFGGRQFLTTPNFLYSWFPNTRTIGGVTNTAPIFRAAVPPPGSNARQRHSWGHGNVLGGN
uniref:Derlin n=1 Tax=Clastoptera arizonana TaxID=38151 RepID=A0A1B6E1M1_9HEMI